MPAPSQEKIQTLVDSVLFHAMPEQRRDKALNMLSRLPLTYETLQRIRDTYNDALGDDQKDSTDLLEVTYAKEQERYVDAGVVLVEAESRGVTSLEELCVWLGIDKDADPQTMIDKMHLYRKVGPKGKPDLSQYGA